MAEALNERSAENIIYRATIYSNNGLRFIIAAENFGIITDANPYHLVNVPIMKTYINCYSNNNETLDALTEKLMGRDDFRGVSPVDPFCGKDYLKY